MIHHVEMTNWRAYDRREFAFEPGITFLMGANGSGKTSVLEAICYALTGDAGLFEGKQRARLLRDPEQNASVSLGFEAGDQRYSILRAQSARAVAAAEIRALAGDRVLASGQTHTTEQVSKLVGVSPDFLRRIVYMAEGDVYRFLSQPPGEALELQIREVLGLTQLDQFTAALERSQKQLKQRMDMLQGLSEDLARLGIRARSDLEDRLNAGENTRALLLGSLEDNREQVLQIQASLERNNRIRENLHGVQQSRAGDPACWEGIDAEPLQDYYASHEQELDRLSQKRQEVELHIARLEGEMQALRRILSVLEPYQNHADTLPCPVCQKPMTEPERHAILHNLQANQETMARETQDLRDIQRDMQADLESLRGRLALLKELRNALAHSTLPDLRPTSTLGDVFTAVSKEDEIRAYLGELEQQRQEIQRRLSELQTQQAEYLAIQKRIVEAGFQAPEEINETLVSLEVRALSIRAASQAAEKTLVAQRDADMQAIYAQVARLWGAFTGEDNWQVALDGKGLPTLQNELGRSFELHQLSGGEKTALLIILHTLIAHRFSRSDFLLIDEPLEHLDPVNRRSLIRFLVESYQQGLFKQAIIATFEETLVRKYLSQDGVHVIPV